MAIGCTPRRRLVEHQAYASAQTADATQFWPQRLGFAALGQGGAGHVPRIPIEDEMDLKRGDAPWVRESLRPAGAGQ